MKKDHIVNFIICLCAMYCGWLVSLTPWPTWIKWAVVSVFWLFFIGFNIFPRWKRRPTKRLTVLAGGVELLVQFLATMAINVVVRATMAIVALATTWDYHNWWAFLGIAVGEGILFANGLARLYLLSRRLGAKWRLLGILCGWIPVVNLWVLVRMIHMCYKEVIVESDRIEIENSREDDSCKTRYPVILVHGVFFRDTPSLSYWGRIPKTLQKKGAAIYFGEHESATSVEASATELAERIRAVMEETGCDKVNLIGHSKGGLDSRYAISCLGMADHVASLTTVNTPHRGCKFVVHLFDKTSTRFQQTVEYLYNHTFRHLGDKRPDFMGAVMDLTPDYCAALNKKMPDMPGVYYQSVGTWMQSGRAGRFPTNISYSLAKRMDGDNDGLVEIESMRWGERFVRIDPTGKRGICHGDIIDLWQEDIPGFDVQGLYVELLQDLKERGF